MSRFLAVVLDGGEDVDAGDEQIVSLKLVTVGALDGAEGPCYPASTLEVLGDPCELAVEDADSLGQRNWCAVSSIIPTHKVGSFTAGYLKAS